MHEQLAAVKAFHEKMNVSHVSPWIAAASLKQTGELLIRLSKDLEKKVEWPEFLRAHLMLEELGEYLVADNEAEALDALTDLLYVLLGTAVTWDWPLVQAFAAVHKSNMTKKKQSADDHRVRSKGSEFKHPDLQNVLDDPGVIDDLDMVLYENPDVLDLRTLTAGQKRDIRTLYMEMLECTQQ